MKRSNTYTNNTSGNIDYSPFAPTDTLNTSFSNNVVGAAAVAATTGLFRGPIAGAESLATGLVGAKTLDALSGQPSISYSITGHEGDTFGHTEF